MFPQLNRLLLILTWPSIILGFSSCSDNVKKAPLPVNGVLDLRSWDFKKDGEIRTTGYWEFYFEDFLNSRQFDTLHEKHYTWVPGVWKGGAVSGSDQEVIREKRERWLPQLPWEHYSWRGKKMGATGYASYNLKILLQPDQEDLSFRISSILTAYRFFINDSLAALNGVAGRTREETQPQFHEEVVVLKHPTDTLRLTFWISNFDYRKGGLSYSVFIADSGTAKQEIRIRDNLILFLAGAYFMVCFILLSFYAYRPKEKINLYLSLWPLAVLVRLLTAEDRVITTILPQINFDLLVKLELISGFGIAPSLILSMRLLFPREFSRLFRDITLYPFLILILVIIFTHPIFYSYWVVPFQIFGVFSMAYTCFCLFLAMIHKREGSLIMGIAIFIGLVTFTTQIFSFMTLSTFRLGSSSWGVGAVFAISQILLLAKISSGALKRVENFASELEGTVKERTGELVRTQEQLIQAARHAETEKVRRRISQDIHDDISSGLNRISWMTELVKVKAQKYKPEEINPALDKIIKSSRETVDNLVEIIWSLNPGSDDLENMLVYMRNFITRFFEDTSFRVTVNFPEHPAKIELNPELKRNLFLVMKEALHNAAKYSKAKNIILDFHYDDSSYLFIITDDGIGLEEGVVKGTGHGMINMRKRMEAVNGTFMVQSEPGKGTKIILEGSFYQ